MWQSVPKPGTSVERMAKHHSGKLLVELDIMGYCNGNNSILYRISAIMETLLGCTGIPAHEQILMCEGSRLDAAKCLSNYSLPVRRKYAVSH